QCPCQRAGARDIAEDDWRAHVTRAVALHPAMLGEGIARELLAEILHHVVPLELPMDQHGDADLPLPAHCGCGLPTKERFVFRIAECSFRMGGTRLAHLFG